MQFGILFPEPVGGHFGVCPQSSLTRAQSGLTLMQSGVLFFLAAELTDDDPEQNRTPYRGANDRDRDDRGLLVPGFKRRLDRYVHVHDQRVIAQRMNRDDLGNV